MPSTNKIIKSDDCGHCFGSKSCDCFGCTAEYQSYTSQPRVNCKKCGGTGYRENQIRRSRSSR